MNRMTENLKAVFSFKTEMFALKVCSLYLLHSPSDVSEYIFTAKISVVNEKNKFRIFGDDDIFNLNQSRNHRGIKIATLFVRG